MNILLKQPFSTPGFLHLLYILKTVPSLCWNRNINTMMNKIFATFVLFLFVQSAIAQKGIDHLIQAGKSFAAYSVAHSTKEAFEQFIDSNSIMFDNGKPLKATEFW